MEVFQPHIHAFGIKALLTVARQSLGSDELEDILRALGTHSQEVSDPNAWFSLEFMEALLEEIMRRTGDSSLLDRIANESLSRASLGFIRTLLRTFGSPHFAYQQVARSTSRFNKLGEYTFKSIDSQKVKLTYRIIEGAPRASSPYICQIRLRQLAAVPTLFDLAPADVEHPRCMMLGDATCDYILTWRERKRQWFAAAGLGIGVALAALLVAGIGSMPVWGDLILALTLAGGGWAGGRVRELRLELADRVRDLLDHQATLTRSLRANEDRFQELLEAKAEVDTKVEVRTHELKEASDRLSETLGAIQALDRAKTDFFNNVSHELRSPLTLILAPLEDMVAGRAPPGGASTAFESMHRNASRLLHLINQLLDLAKIDAGEMQIHPVPTDVVALVRSILKRFEAAAQKKGVQLDSRAPIDLPAVVLDASWIESAITNLVANALRLTRRGGAVRVTVIDHGGDVSIAVSDDGPGIAPEDQKKVFERFAQGDSTKRIVGGTGIGLALVREAARLHAGEVNLVSELGRGATFTLVLPRRPEAHDPNRTSERLVPSSQPPPPMTFAIDGAAEEKPSSDRPGPTPNAPLALVVEDNPELREFIVNVLAVRYRVRSANDGTSGLAMARELKPDVVVSDVAMPEMNGYELCRALRSDTEMHSVPILLVTARTDAASVLQGFEAGANDYVLKPFHGRELLARVDVHVRLRRMMQELALHERHAMLGVLAASVAHQVRNPLTTLVSGLPAMRSRLAGQVTEPTKQLIDIMIDCAGRIERITVDLMDLSRVDRETGGDFIPSDGLRAAIRLVKARIPTALVIEEQVEDSPMIHGRAGDMNHVFLNLLDNAVRAIGEHGRIHVEAVTTAGAYIVRVGDSGGGVDAEIAKRIFEPFFTTRQAGEGTGLGLAIARQVLQQCGGDITLGRSELGGALFTAEIPTSRQPSRSAHEQSTGEQSTT